MVPGSEPLPYSQTAWRKEGGKSLSNKHDDPIHEDSIVIAESPPKVPYANITWEPMISRYEF